MRLLRRDRFRQWSREDQDPVADAHQLGKVRGDDEDALPRRRQPPEELVDLETGADVDPARRLVEDEHLGAAEEPLGDHHLLLIASREVGNELVDRRRLDVQVVDQLPGGAPLRRILKEAGVGDPPQIGDGHVGRARHCQDEPLRLAVLGEQADAVADGVARAADAHLGAVAIDAP